MTGDVMGAKQRPALTVEETLAERDSRYGGFLAYAAVAQRLHWSITTSAMQRARSLPDDASEALHAIAGKMARVLTGDPNYRDNWVDIAGYAQLVLNRIDADKVPVDGEQHE